MSDSKHFRNVYVILKGPFNVPVSCFSSNRKALDAKYRMLYEARNADCTLDSKFDVYYENMFSIKRLTVL